MLSVDKIKPQPLKPSKKNKARDDHCFPCSSNIQIWNRGYEDNNNHYTMHVSAPKMLQFAPGSTTGMSTVPWKVVTNWLKANSNHCAGSRVICFAPWTSVQTISLTEGDLWYITAYPGWAAVLFLQPWFKKRKRSLFSASCINQSLSPPPFLFGYGLGWVKSASTCISISRD